MGGWICYLVVFEFLFIFTLTKLFSKMLWTKYDLLMQSYTLYSRHSILDNIKMSNLVILKWQQFGHKAKFEKKTLFKCRSKTGISIKWCLFKDLPKLLALQKHFLIANIVKGTVWGLRQFLATESPWKEMKNAFYFISKSLFFVKRFKVFPWVFGCVEITAWLER